MKSFKPTRQIHLLLEIGWEDYEDASEEMILEDAIIETADGVAISILPIEDETNVTKTKNKYGRQCHRQG